MISQWMAMLIGYEYVIAKHDQLGWHIAERILASNDVQAAEYVDRNYSQEWQLIDGELLNECAHE